MNKTLINKDVLGEEFLQHVKWKIVQPYSLIMYEDSRDFLFSTCILK